MSSAPPPGTRDPAIAGKAFVTIVSLYAMFFMEWLFFVTKPSFLSVLPVAEKLAVLLVTPLPTVLAGLLLLAVCHRADLQVRRPWFSPLVPAMALTAMAFMLIDNFTHTVFGFYTASHAGLARYGYATLILLIFLFCYGKVSNCLASGMWQRTPTVYTGMAVCLPLISLLLALPGLFRGHAELGGLGPVQLERRLNILIISADGVEAGHMSAYGYTRETTPFIDSLLGESLVAENSYTNSASTTGAVGALLSGKLPTRTRLIYPPGIFTGLDIVQHFAGILHQNGYRSLDVSVPHYADSYDLNMRNAFDATTGLEQVPKRLMGGGKALQLGLASQIYFQGLVFERIVSRAGHAFSIRDMVDPYALVTQQDPAALTDAQRFERLTRFISENKERPFFAHVHLMETHGPKFETGQRLFSRNSRQSRPWMDDFYDDAVRAIDERVKTIVEFLKTQALYENTIIVITSDHGMGWATETRIPLIIKFPGRQYSGRLSVNTQRADIPVTLLDYLGGEIPPWMDGASLIAGELPGERLIFATRPGETHEQQLKDYGPPFFGLGKLSVIRCQQFMQLDLDSRAIQQQRLEAPSEPCAADTWMSEQQAFELLVSHLADAGYDMTGY